MDWCKLMKLNCVLAAPTGRAAAGKGCTVHRLFGINPDKGKTTTLAQQFDRLQADEVKMRALAKYDVCAFHMMTFVSIVVFFSWSHACPAVECVWFCDVCESMCACGTAV